MIGGILAGVVFAMMEMVYAAIAKGSFFAPLGMVASLPLQQPPPQIPLGTAIVVGLATHMVLSMMFGFIAAVIIGKFASVVSSPFGIVDRRERRAPDPVAPQLLRHRAPTTRSLVRHPDRLVLARAHRPHDLLWNGPRRLPGEPAPKSSPLSRTWVLASDGLSQDTLGRAASRLS